MITNSLASHGSICVLSKDLLSQSLRQRVEEYSEDSLHKIGQIIIILMEKMIRPGYFHLTINPNSKLNKIGKGRRYTIITIT